LSLTNIIESILLLFQVLLAPADSNGQTAFERMERRLHHPGESILRTAEAERAKVRISQTVLDTRVVDVDNSVFSPLRL
jgi:hypothetical protein